MGNKKNDSKYQKEHIEKSSLLYLDSDLPTAPKLEIYKETFGDLKNITEKWYKENRG